jgi:DoxX-like family
MWIARRVWAVYAPPTSDCISSIKEILVQTTLATSTISKSARWAGVIISGLATLFLIFDGGIKALQLAPAIEATVQLGYPAGAVFGLGMLQLACLAAYVIPRTSVLGAILLTGYLGGAIATQVRVGAPVFSLMFAVAIGAMIWGGLLLRDQQLRALIPLRRSTTM